MIELQNNYLVLSPRPTLYVQTRAIDQLPRVRVCVFEASMQAKISLHVRPVHVHSGNTIFVRTEYLFSVMEHIICRVMSQKPIL